MKKTYQPFIIENANTVINSLIDIEFFISEGITSTEYANELICNKLTEKFILGDLSSTDEILFTEKEMTEILHMITVRNSVNGLIEKGLVTTYENEDGEELLVLTEKGKELAKKQNTIVSE